MMVLLAGGHSLGEYPLWYAYVLLPTAWALGHALRHPASIGRRALPPPPPASQSSTWALPLLGAALLAGALYAVWDYHRVVLIYQPGNNPASLAERIANGQRSPLFGHHADYAAATTGEPPGQGLAPFAITTHALLDTRLMMAWANALAATGQAEQIDQARYLAARLREFHNPASDAFFAPCADPGLQPPPFQCEKPKLDWGWRDFIR
jgi:hypothetical protein